MDTNIHASKKIFLRVLIVPLRKKDILEVIGENLILSIIINTKRLNLLFAVVSPLIDMCASVIASQGWQIFDFDCHSLPANCKEKIIMKLQQMDY